MVLEAKNVYISVSLRVAKMTMKIATEIEKICMYLCFGKGCKNEVAKRDEEATNNQQMRQRQTKYWLSRRYGVDEII